MRACREGLPGTTALDLVYNLAGFPTTLRKVFLNSFAILCLCLCALRVSPVSHLYAGGPLEGESDIRLGEPRHLDLDFPFRKVKNLEEWELRSRHLRVQLQVASGLYPFPPRTRLHAVVHGRVQRSDYTVEKVYFESVPGHYVTGNLYRPTPGPGRLPGVLSPHGHMGDSLQRHENGRFHDHGADGVREEIRMGAERFEVGGRYPMQARAVQLARMGCVVFQYDMVGYGDSLQLPHKGLGPRRDGPAGWRFSSARAELHLQSVMMLQTWNSIRALDFLISLPDVDPARIGVEGHSGGGTQTFVLAALDERPAVVFPAVMVSTSMQGGCICENACYLRIGAGNVDFAALAAPRPMGLTGADDWTRKIRTSGLPDLKEVYGFYDGSDRVEAEVFPQFGHNYNSVSRTVMYKWLNRHLDLKVGMPIEERDFLPLTRDEMSVWNDNHPLPQGPAAGDSHEKAVLAWFTDTSHRQLEELWPRSPEGHRQFRAVLGRAFDVILGRRLEDVGPLESRTRSEGRSVSRASRYRWRRLLLSNRFSEEVPVIAWSNGSGGHRTLIWITEGGIQDLSSSENEPAAAIRRLLASGVRVLGVDLLGQGTESARAGHERNRLVRGGDGSEQWQQHAAYTFGYNYPLFSQRVHDLLTVMSYVRSKWPETQVLLLGLGPVAGPLAAAARAQAEEIPYRTAIGSGAFRFETILQFEHSMFLPGAARYLDLPALILLPAQGGDLWLTGEDEASMEKLREAHEAAELSFKLEFPRGVDADSLESALNWLTDPS